MTEQAWDQKDLERNPHAAEDKPSRVRRMFEAIAPAYDLNNRLHSFWRDQAWRKKAVRLASVRPEDDVLDVACGTGDLTEALAKAGPKSIVGLDYTPGMLEIAKDKLQKRRDGLDISYVQGDATRLECDDESKDVITIAFGIRNVGEPDRAFAEFFRVLRPRADWWCLNSRSQASPRPAGDRGSGPTTSCPEPPRGFPEIRSARTAISREAWTRSLTHRAWRTR